MKIAAVRIQNFRSIRDATVTIGDYTCLVGPNGAGKSTILCALNIFFRESDHSATDLGRLDSEDFHLKKTADPVEITVTFTDLSAEAEADFADYVRQGQLVISAKAVFDPTTGRAEVQQFGQRVGMPEFAVFFREMNDGKPAADLKAVYSKLRDKYTELPAWTSKPAAATSLNQFEADHSDQCELIPSLDQFYGFSKGLNRLARHVQWVFVPAVKDASTEQLEARNTALGKILARTVRSKVNFTDRLNDLRNNALKQYHDLLTDNQDALNNISAALAARITEWAHPDATLRIEWSQDPQKSIQVQDPLARIIAGDGAFEGELSRFGHGYQRSYLLALLQELAGLDDSNNPRLILGCEEPELYQHPPQARHLSAVLNRLSTANSQVLVSTHYPAFVSGKGFEDVRVVRRDPTTRESCVAQARLEDISKAIAAATGEPAKKPSGVRAQIHQALQPALNEMFFTSRLVLVEGLEDVAYVTTYLHLLGLWDRYRQKGWHLVPVNGKSEILQPLVVAGHMGIPTFVVFDADGDKPDRSGSRTKHEKDNRALLTVLKSTTVDPFPTATLWGTNFVMWTSDIGSIVAKEIGEDAWQAAQQEADKEHGQVGGLRKNLLHIGSALTTSFENGLASTSLKKLCEMLAQP